MNVRAIGTSAEVSPSCGTDPRRTFPVIVGLDYLVYTIACIYGEGEYSGLTLYGVEDEFGRLMSVPSSLFEITDARASRYWVASSDADSFYLCPREFVENVYLSDEIHEDVPGARAQFREIKAKLEAEASNQTLDMAIGAGCTPTW